MVDAATFDRPTKGTLHVHLENGEVMPATAEHLTAFGYVDRHHAWERGRQFFMRLVDVADTDDLTLAGSMLHSLLDYATLYDGHDMDPNPNAPEGPWAEEPDMEAAYATTVADLRRLLRSEEPRWPGGYRTPEGTEPVR